MNDNTIGWKRKNIERLRSELRTLEDELAAAENTDDAQAKELATELHALTCHWNHTDGCGWYYSEDWEKEYARKEYLKKAFAILEECDFETALKVLKISQLR